ncbi:MAG TPA: class I SAM-dependent methyltransferase [Mycobacteriales bacterium]|nr:class I SAM-dependent methyltransferase [Mycobacteriales bacterium]
MDEPRQEDAGAAPGGPTPEEIGAGVEHFMGDVRGYLSFWLLMLGHRTGILAAVRSGGGTATEIADRAGTHERSTREWLAGMTAAGYLEHDAGRFTMPLGQAALFEGGVLPFDPTVLFTFPDVINRVQDEVEESMRDGRGVPYDRFQPEFSAAQDAINAPLYSMFLVQDWVPSVSGLAERLEAGADVADIGCGGGRALCALAAAFPASRFTGYDLDEAALAIGTARAAEQGLSNVTFERRDIAQLGQDGMVDVVLAVDAIHDQAAPQQVVEEVVKALRPGGVFMMVEPTASGDLDEDIKDPMSVMGYATSLAHCVQVSLAGGGPGLGGMWGSVGAQALLRSAGFADVQEHRSASDHTVFAARR